MASRSSLSRRVEVAGIEEIVVISAGIVDGENGVADRAVDQTDFGEGAGGGHGDRSVFNQKAVAPGRDVLD